MELIYNPDDSSISNYISFDLIVPQIYNTYRIRPIVFNSALKATIKRLAKIKKKKEGVTFAKESDKEKGEITEERRQSHYSRCFEGQDCIPPAGVRGSFGCGRFGRRGGAARIQRDSSSVGVHAGCREPSPGRSLSCCIRARTPRATLNFHAGTREDRFTELRTSSRT